MRQPPPSLSVRCASVAKGTPPRSALPPYPGTRDSKPFAPASTADSPSVKEAAQSVPSGRKKTDAKTPTPTSTFALGAELTPTALANVLELRKQQPQTPYNLTEWQREFSLLNLHARFPKILSGLAYGFTINFPPILRTQCPPNNVSISSFDSDFRTIVCKEITKGRYIGPFPLSLIEQVLGPYQSSLLSIIPKQGCPGKFRVIQNFSFPANPSPPFPNPAINHYISAKDFPTTWGKFSTIYSLITHLPPGSEAAT